MTETLTFSLIRQRWRKDDSSLWATGNRNRFKGIPCCPLSVWDLRGIFVSPFQLPWRIKLHLLMESFVLEVTSYIGLSPLDRDCVTYLNSIASSPLSPLMCSLTPSVTLYGTTQIPTVRTITHTITSTELGEPVVTRTATTTTQCDAFGQKCGPQVVEAPVTVIPTNAVFTTSVEIRTTIAARVIPQQTLYYPCTFSPPPEPLSITSEVMTEVSEIQHAQTSDTPIDQTLSSSHSSRASSSTSSVESVKPEPAIITTSTQIQTRLTKNIPSTISTSILTSSYLTVSTSLSNGTGDRSNASDPHPTSKSNTGGAIAGGIAGGIVGLIILCALITYLRQARSASRRNSRSTVLTDYWERKFRALEAAEDVFPVVEGGEKGNDGHPETLEAKKIRLTLDLHSNRISTRPASRLSTISSFFMAKAQPLQFSATRSDSRKGALNFSRPYFGHKRQSSKVPNITKRTHSGRSHSTHRSNFPREKTEWAGENADGSEIHFSGEKEDERFERSAMEWIRPATIVDIDNKDEWRPRTPNLSPPQKHQGTTGSLMRQLTPPRSTNPQSSEPLPRHAASNSLDSSYSGISSHSSPPQHQSLSHSINSKQTPDRPTLSSVNGRNSSFEAARRSKGKTVPKLPLSREAITPSLWIDDETYDEFRRVEESRFSADSSVVDVVTATNTAHEDPYDGLAKTETVGSRTPTTSSNRTSCPASLVRAGSQLERSAVTPQLPIIPVGGTGGLGIEWRA